MEVSVRSPITFKSDYFLFEKNGKGYNLKQIKTDDQPEDGKNLCLCANRIHERPRFTFSDEYGMTYDGKYYLSPFLGYDQLRSYEILNKKNGAGKRELDYDAITENLRLQEMKKFGLPLEKTISKGTVEGVVVTDINNIPPNMPVIAMFDKLLLDSAGACREFLNLGNNVRGVIMNYSEGGLLDHITSLIRQYVEVSSIVSDREKFNDLKKLAGKKVSLSNENGLVEFREIKNFSKLEDVNLHPPNVPVLDEETKLLDFLELTRKNSGEKAYRLGVMQRLIKDGYLADVEVPQGFVIPVGYINNVLKYTNLQEYQNKSGAEKWNNHFDKELAKYCKKYGIDIENNLIMRSAFNLEDLYDCPTPGIYTSLDSNHIYGCLVSRINEIVKSKDNLPAVRLRERYGIPDALVQPTVIVQNQIRAKHPFTVYTDIEGKLKIEMFSDEVHPQTLENPAIISYDRNSEEIKLEQAPNNFGTYIIRDDGEVIEQHPKKDYIVNNWKSLLAPIGIVIKNALKLEEYFGRPQDIEGGIKNGKVYFWQTRDIVKKVVR